MGRPVPKARALMFTVSGNLATSGLCLGIRIEGLGFRVKGLG